MAYPSPQSIRPEIRNMGRGVSEAKLADLISEGIELVTLGMVDAEENAWSRRAVRSYVKAEALRIMRELGDKVPQDLIDAADDRFRNETDSYHSSTLSTADDSGDRPKAIVGITPW